MPAVDDLPSTARAAVLEQPKSPFKIINRPVQLPQDGQVLVKVLACGVCGGDIAVKNSLWPGLSYPVVPGHEIVGIVAATPDSESVWKIGQRVGVSIHGKSCFRCSLCRKGIFSKCEQNVPNGFYRDGGFAEFCIMNTEALVPIPEDMDPAEAAPLLCAGVTTFNSLRNVHGTVPGDLVVVQGVGGLGHLAIQYAKKAGFSVVALSSSSKKEQLAKDLGTDVYLDSSKCDAVEELNRLGGAKVIICTAPKAEAIGPLVNGLAVDGTLLLLPLADGPIVLDSTPIIMKRASIQGWLAGSPIDCEETVRFSHKNGVKCIVQRYTLDQVNEAFEAMVSGSALCRGVLVM